MIPVRPGPRPELSVVAVHYRTPGLLEPALAAVARQLDELGSSHELVVVDNSGDAPALAGRQVLRPGRNLGYAGGLVAGVEASRGEVLVALNPDVVVLPGCLRELLAALGAGAGVVGPRFYWDGERRLMLPPGEDRAFASELLRALAARSDALTRRARRRWRRHARAHWTASAPLASWTLSGALLAIRRTVWDAVGPFDAGYPLYFEETDWLARARRRGVLAHHVPRAEAVHHFDQSGRLEPERDRWYAESCRRFRERHYGRLAARALELVEAGARPVDELPPWPPPQPPSGPAWMEVSPRREGFPAAAERAVANPASWRLPAEVQAHHPGLPLYLTACADDGRELARHALAVASPRAPASATPGALDVARGRI
jgi:N-acetylglucosaminyl-diphospho-decaprenol L-rhamnosyltransferase